MSKADKQHYALYAAMAALVTVAILIFAKGSAWLSSGSASVLASLVDSVIDAAVSIMNFCAIRYSMKPADHEHRHGHGKIEGLSAMFQGAFIFGAGVFLVFESLSRFTQAAPIEAHMMSIQIMAFSIIISVALVAIQNHTLKQVDSLAVASEKAHYATDVVLNGAVIAVLFLLYKGAPLWLDPLFALLVAAYLGYTAKNIVAGGLDMLLDRELPDEQRQLIFKTIRAHPDVHNVHDLRTRKSGMRVYIYFDLELDADKSLRAAHEVAHDVEQALLAHFPHAEIMIHKDPYGVPHPESRHHVPEVHLPERLRDKNKSRSAAEKPASRRRKTARTKKKQEK